MSLIKIALVLVFILVVAGLGVGWWIQGRGFSALDEPGGVETFVAGRLRKLAMPETARDSENPVSKGPEIMASAMAHYVDHCAVCHANNGSGDSTIGRGLYPKTPDLRQSNTQKLTDGELAYIIHNGIRFTGMPGFGEAGAAIGADTWELVHFIRHIPNITEADLEKMETLTPKSPADLQQQDEFERFLRGEDVIPTPHSH